MFQAQPAGGDLPPGARCAFMEGMPALTCAQWAVVHRKNNTHSRCSFTWVAQCHCDDAF
jgi:hypothetical protein